MKILDGLNLFIKDSIKVHGDRYDYSKVNYIDSNTKVNIVCKTHGLFNTDPVNHVYSESGCPECKIDTLTKSTEEFIKESDFLENLMIAITFADVFHPHSLTKQFLFVRNFNVRAFTTRRAHFFQLDFFNLSRS